MTPSIGRTFKCKIVVLGRADPNPNFKMYVDAKWPLDALSTLVRAFTPELIRLPRNRVGAAAWSLQTVYDLAAKRRVVYDLTAIDNKRRRS